MKKLDDYFSTSCLDLATVISLWYPLEVVDKSNPKKAEFRFKQSTDLDQLVKAYWGNELRIEPKQFFSQLKIIKSRLYDNHDI